MEATLMLRFGKVATPFTAATVTVPAKVMPGVVLPVERVTLLVAVVIVRPASSWIATEIAGRMGLPAVVVVGWTVNTSFVGFRGVVVSLQAMVTSSVATRSCDKYDAEADAGRMDQPPCYDSETMLRTCDEVNQSPDY